LNAPIFFPEEVEPKPIHLKGYQENAFSGC